MTDTTLSDAAAFFDAFVEAFATFDGRVVAERYLAPYLSMSADGRPEYFTEHADIGAYFQSILDDYHNQGARTCGYEALEATKIGAGALRGVVLPVQSSSATRGARAGRPVGPVIARLSGIVQHFL